jgi:fructokinase
MRNSNTTCLNGEPLDRQLSAALGRPIRLANDANCFALSEAIDGAGRAADVVFGVIVGTGTGGGVVVHQRLLVGPNAVAGEWGHNPLPWFAAEDGAARACYCGKFNCLETFLSGAGLVETARQRTGATWTPRALADAARNGEVGPRQTLDLYAQHLARGLATVINVLDPDVIVLGGGLSNIDYLYGAVNSALASWVFSDRVLTPVVRAQHGDSSGVRGAAWLCNDG